MQTVDIVSNKTFPPETVLEIDGEHFVGCVFDHCRLVYQGIDEPSFEDCTFIGCNWTFNGPAENVLGFLGDLYLGLGEEGERLVESVFEAVRLGRVRNSEIPLLSAAGRSPHGIAR